MTRQVEHKVVTNIHTHMRSVTLRPAMDKNQIECGRVRRSARIAAVFPQVARAKIRNQKTEIAQDSVGILLTICSSIYSLHARSARKMIRVVSHVPELLGDGDRGVSKICAAQFETLQR